MYVTLVCTVTPVFLSSITELSTSDRTLTILVDIYTYNEKVKVVLREPLAYCPARPGIRTWEIAVQPHELIRNTNC